MAIRNAWNRHNPVPHGRTMIQPKGLDLYFERLPRVSDAELTRILLDDLCAHAAEMSVATLRAFRAECLERHGDEKCRVVLEAIDWLVALREMDSGFGGPSRNATVAQQSRF